jgi:hypothetical protein
VGEKQRSDLRLGKAAHVREHIKNSNLKQNQGVRLSEFGFSNFFLSEPEAKAIPVTTFRLQSRHRAA